MPVQVSPTVVQYVTNLQWVDTPDHLFKNLVAETVRRTTDRVVLDPARPRSILAWSSPASCSISAMTRRRGQVVVEYDASLSTAGGNQVQTRRFTATAPADGTRRTVGPALNRAANEVARRSRQWIGG